MLLKRMVKRIMPKSIKKYIKNSLALAPESKTTEYIIRTSDIDRLYGKRVIVTGGTGAIGSAICHRLLLEGAIVGVCGRSEEKLKSVIKRFHDEKLPGNGVAVPLNLDVTSDENIENVIRYFVKEYGSIDAFINNAGGGARGDSKLLHEQDISVIDYVLNTNLRGSMICARKAAQVMTSQGYGKIINMSSVVGMQGKSKMTDYATAKAGIIGFTKSLAIELGEHNITVNCISPGMVNQIPFDAGIPVKATNTNCLKRFGYTDEVANLVAFIVSNESNYITGHNFVIDGGRSLGLRGD